MSNQTVIKLDAWECVRPGYHVAMTRGAANCYAWIMRHPDGCGWAWGLARPFGTTSSMEYPAWQGASSMGEAKQAVAEYLARHSLPAWLWTFRPVTVKVWNQGEKQTVLAYTGGMAVYPHGEALVIQEGK